ncbi:30S ribosomal protein S5 [Candidatus Hecatella orcuttiae]|uniref:30S ribosomal protein S5 n=1 Tax=Candidatus Hecatella orcuttiae TaxID=1935119 RepID=UPI002867F23B|nr:30S ribosomal protein S5 [Candidatus Hecatella orcuttiae]
MSAEVEWVPKTKLGRMVLEGKIVSLDEIFAQGLRIQETEIVDRLMPNLRQEVLSMSIVQKQTDAGEQSRFKVVVAVGNEDGYIGVDSGKAKQIRGAIEKATMYAKLNITPVRRGCGSWECACHQPHSLPFKTVGKCGSVRVELIPGPRGLGIVANETTATILRLSGIKDCWSRSFGSTKTTSSLAYAVYYALRNTYKTVAPQDWTR